jgi:AcrR family transcriptional regulator
VTSPQASSTGAHDGRRPIPVVDPPPPSLRERKKAAAIHHIQTTALDLFARHGFDKVTIEQVAEAAEVSPSTVYRYFATKEGLVLHDEYDDRLISGLAHYLGQGMPALDAVVAALSLVDLEHFGVEEVRARARMQLMVDHPSVRAAAYLLVDTTADELARLLADTGRWTFPRARVVCSAIVWALMGALRNWHDAGGRGGWRQHLEEALVALGEAAPTPEAVQRLHEALHHDGSSEPSS